jgi:uncharacterized protein (TIGR02421 family)
MEKLDHFAELDAELVSAAKGIKILSRLAWKPEVITEFLENWRKGSPQLPAVQYPTLVLEKERHALRAVMDKTDRGHPLGEYIFQTAASYHLAASMLEHLGTPLFTELSGQIYGLPKNPVTTGSWTNLDAAQHFISTSRDFAKHCQPSNYDHCVLPQSIATELQTVADTFFGERLVTMVVDPALTSKAAAGANRVRIRGLTCFSAKDTAQLLQHEFFVHTLSMRNGRAQPHFKSLGLGAPRTTVAQEGLALFAELITTSIDINRLRRIAFRVEAIQRALDGADFLEIFKLFLDEGGQNEQEAFYSAMRIFRGGDVRGHVAFTKDSIYLSGLLLIHTFLRKSIQVGKVFYPHYLFAGRLALHDIINLEQFFLDGSLALPLHEPAWVTDRPSLTAFLLYSAFAEQIALKDITLAHFATWGV